MTLQSPAPFAQLFSLRVHATFISTLSIGRRTLSRPGIVVPFPFLEFHRCDQVSAPLLALAIGATLASLGVLPATSAVYDSVWSVLLPPGVALLMLQADLKSLVGSSRASVLVRAIPGPTSRTISPRASHDGNACIVVDRFRPLKQRPTAQAFACGAVGTLVGTLVAFAIAGSSMGSSGWQLAACLCASYIGGRREPGPCCAECPHGFISLRNLLTRLLPVRSSVQPQFRFCRRRPRPRRRHSGR